MPGVFKGLDLGVGGLARRALEQDVVIGLAVERRVEVDQIDTVARYLIAQHVEIVAIVKCVRHSAPS